MSNTHAWKLIGLGLLLALTIGTAPVASAQWAGDNGLIRFSFVEGDSLVSTLHREAKNGVTMVDVYAWLTDVVPVALNGEAFLALGGFEFTLSIDGAEAFIVAKDVAAEGLDMGNNNAACIVGLKEGIRIRDERAYLVHWQVMFQGDAQDVVFGLEAGPGQSCTTQEGCAECAPPAIYIGVESSRQIGTFFGAGYARAYLNPTGATDATPVTGSCSYRDVGLFERR